MAAIDIPAGLTLRALRESYAPEPAALIRSGTDSGRSKQRPRDDAEIYTTPVQFRMTRLQYHTLFLPWWRDDLGYGALAFNWTEPFTDRDCEAQFLGDSPPTPSRRPNGRIQIASKLFIVI